MFTRNTKYFGIWRDHHPSKTRYAGNPTRSFVFSLSVATFVTSLVFFLVLKIRGDFFLLDSLDLDLPAIASTAKNSAFHGYQPSTLSVALITNKERPGSTTLIFDNGESYEFPAQKEKLTQATLKRLDFLELFSMLNLSIPPGTGRLQLLPENNVPWLRINEILSFFGVLGFDDVDIATRIAEKKS